MGCGDDDSFGRNAGGFGGEGFGLVANIAGDHAAIDDGDGDVGFATLEDEAAGLEIAGIHFSAFAFSESSR